MNKKPKAATKNFNKRPNQLRAFFTLAYYFFKAQTRNPATFAFGFIFPIVFISIFGLIGSGNQKLTIGVPEKTHLQNPIIQSMDKLPYVTVTKDTLPNLEENLKKSKIAGIVSVSQTSIKTYSVKLITSSANPQASGAISALVQGTVDKANLSLSGVSNPPISISQAEVSGREARYIDFALPGQIGFSLLSTAIFGTVFGLVFLKKALVLKRMFATPTLPITILVSQGASRWIIAMMQTLLILGIGVFIFHFYLPHGWITLIELIIISSIGLVAFLGFGYFMAGLANDENSAGPLVNLITLPQFLLSGTFFPIDNLPAWLQPIANNLPLSYFNYAVRVITTEGGTFPETWPYLLGLVLWGVGMYILAAKTFRWT